MKWSWHQKRMSSGFGAGVALLSLATSWVGCAPRAGSETQQSLSEEQFHFAWGGYIWRGIPDSAQPQRSVSAWTSSDQIRFYVKKHEVLRAAINAIHPTRAFRNVNGGTLPMDAEGYVERDENGRLRDGNVKSKEGLIQGVILRSSQGNLGLPMNCFRNLIPGSAEEQECTDKDGNRYLSQVKQEDFDYVFRTSAGIEIARAHKQLAQHSALGTFMDPESDARERQEVSIVTVGSGVSVWGGVLLPSPEVYNSRPQTCIQALLPENGVFKRPLPTGYAGKETFVHDALSDASCYLRGRPTSLKVQCTRYHMDPTKPAQAGRFCLEAEVQDLSGNQSFPESTGGFGIWLVVDVSSTQSSAHQQSNENGQTPSQASPGTAAICAALTSRTSCAWEGRERCKWLGYSGQGQCVPVGTVAPEGVPDFSAEGRATQQSH